MKRAKKPPVDGYGRLCANVTCFGCEYNLRGLAADGVCPECGLKIDASTKRWSELPLPKLGKLTLWLVAVGYAFFAMAYLLSKVGWEDLSSLFGFVGAMVGIIAFVLSAMAFFVRAEADRGDRIKILISLLLTGLPIGVLVLWISMVLIFVSF